MKKIAFLLLIIMIIITGILVYYYNSFDKEKRKVDSFNLEYERYNTNDLNGLDITSLINKAINNNEKYAVPKDQEGLYILDDENSIEIYVKMIINNNTYRMEKINKLGINSFVAYFGEVSFKCIEITYHEENGKIATMTFEANEY